MNFDVSHGVHPLLSCRPGVFVVPGKPSLTKKLPGVPVVILLPPLPALRSNGTYAGNARLLRAVLKELREGLEVRRRQPEVERAVDRPDRLLKETSFRPEPKGSSCQEPLSHPQETPLSCGFFIPTQGQGHTPLRLLQYYCSNPALLQ